VGYLYSAFFEEWPAPPGGIRPSIPPALAKGINLHTPFFHTPKTENLVIMVRKPLQKASQEEKKEK
jgi:hypothetical protein